MRTLTIQIDDFHAAGLDALVVGQRAAVAASPAGQREPSLAAAVTIETVAAEELQQRIRRHADAVAARADARDVKEAIASADQATLEKVRALLLAEGVIGR